MSSFQNTQIALAVAEKTMNSRDLLDLINDARYGLVKAWPSAAWSAVFGVDLDVLFNGETA